MSDDRRNETQLLCDILGLESLVDEITSKQAAGISSSSTATPTPSAILGPFYRAAAPILANGSSVVRNLSPSVPWHDKAVADSAFISGRVFSSHTSNSEAKRTSDRTPLAGAIVDVWLAAPNGLYEQQDASQAEMNLRGRFVTDEDGCYSLYALRPPAYPIPDDGPAGRLLGLLDRHPFRPAHVHFVVTAPGHRPLTTQIFDSRDKYITDDAVFAVKDELVVEWLPRQGDNKAKWEVKVDFVLGVVTP
jgi:catechol 1,2-dioxygenase